MNPIRVALVGVGNCASSLVQGVHYYRDAAPEDSVPGLMHVEFGPYHVRDVEFVAAFDVDAKKVGSDLSDAINASENNTIKICDVPPSGVSVNMRNGTDDVSFGIAHCTMFTIVIVTLIESLVPGEMKRTPTSTVSNPV